MDGIAIDWKRISGGEKIQLLVNDIINNYSIEKPELSAIGLVKLYKALQTLPGDTWRNKKMNEVQQLVEECSALFIEATTGQPNVVQGDTLRTTFFINKRHDVNASLKEIRLEDFDSAVSIPLEINQNFTFNKTFKIL